MINDHFNSLADEISSESDPASFSKHRSDTGINREGILTRILKDHLPGRLSAINGGAVINLAGELSKPIDVIIKSDIYPGFDLHGKRCVVTESVAGAISVKTMLDKSTLEESIEDLASIPIHSEKTLSFDDASTNKSGFGERYSKQWPFRAIFAYDGDDPDMVYKHARDYYNSNTARIYLFPTLIAINKSICIRYMPEGGESQDGQQLPPRYMDPLRLTKHTKGYPLAGIITALNNYVSWMTHMRYDFSPYIEKAYGA